MTFKIGADPEFFLRDTNTGKFVNAHGMVPGTKQDPLPVEGGAVQVDGMALEFNIDPATSFKEFDTNINRVLEQLREMVPSHLEFVFAPVAVFGKEYMEAQPVESLELGCDPDYSAWLGGANPKPDGSRDFRTASGHIHIGWTEGQDITHPDHIEACTMLTKQLDVMVGVPSLLWDDDRVRRTMYGQFGAYRPKHYGVEYRTLSNVWVPDATLRKIVYEQSMRAAEHLVAGTQYYRNVSPFRVDATAQTHGQLIYSINDTVSQSKDLGKFLNDLYPRVGNKSRPHAVEWTELTRTAHFYNNVTYELIHCDDLTDQMYSTGEWSTQSPYLHAGRSAGLGNTLNATQFAAADAARRAKKKAIKKPAHQLEDYLTVALAN